MNHVAPRRSTILVMHPDPLLRAGLVAALRQHAAFETFVDGVDDAISDRPRIDVVITDYDNAMRLAASVHPAHDTLAAARILVLTTNDREADIRRAIEAGIHGYILLGGPLDELIEGATTVANGLRYVSRSVAQRMADSLTHTSLTSREIEVLSLVAAGESNKAIARELRIEAGHGQVAHDGDHDQARRDLAHPGRQHRSHARPRRATRGDAADAGSAGSSSARRCRQASMSCRRTDRAAP